MDRFLEMQTFVAVVEAGSFVRAAESLQISKPAVSRHIGELEARLGVRLLQRTTRRLSLTQEGEVFHARCRAVLGELEEAESELTSRTGQAIGVVRVNAPLSFGILHLAALWGEFMERNPQVRLEVMLSDRLIDVIEEGFDVSVRIADLPGSSLVSRKLSSTRLVLCAAPRYLQRAGTPAHPADLASHTTLSYNYLAHGDVWHFTGPEGPVEVRLQPVLHTNSGDTCRVAAIQGHGIVLQPSFLVGPDLASGALVEILPQFRSVEFGIYAIFATRKFVTPKVRLLIDFLAAAFEKPRWPA